MHDSVFDRYRAVDSPLHRLDPRIKVLVTVAFILSNVLLPDGAWLAFLLSYLTLLASTWYAGLGVGYTTRRSVIVLPFALAALTAVFSVPGTTLGEWTIGPWHLVASDAGLLRFISILVRAWLSVQGAILLVATTRFPDLVHALEHLRLPLLLVTVIAFLYRYMFVLSDEALRLMRARQSRAALLPGQKNRSSILWRARVAGNMVGQLFIRSYERSDRIYHAMLARGYEGQVRTLNPHQMTSRDWGYLLLAAAGFLTLQLLGHIL